MTKQNANQTTCLWPCWWQSWQQIAKPTAQCRGSFWKVVVPSRNSPARRRHRSDRGYGYACLFHTTARCGPTCRLELSSGISPARTQCCFLSKEINFFSFSKGWSMMDLTAWNGESYLQHSSIPLPNTQTLSFSGIASLQCGEAQYCRTIEKEKRLAKEMSLWLGSKTLRRTLISFSFWYPSFSSSL